MWQVFEAESANELCTKTLAALRGSHGVHVQPSRVGETREILHAALTLKNPRRRWATARRPAMNPAFAFAEVFWILGGRRDAHFVRYFNRSLTRHAGTAACFHGAYGYRLRRHFHVDQLERAYETLRANPNSRQVILQIWDPKSDLPESGGEPRDADIPCNTESILKVRAGKLEWVQIMRSNDVFRGLPHNLVQFTMLQEILAGWLGLAVGEYHHLSDSLHLYDRDLVTMEGLADAPVSIDDFTLPKAESDRVIPAVIAAIEKIVDDAVTAPALADLGAKTDLPDPYRSALCVLIAEGLRRRGDAVGADALIGSHCASETFALMWANWCRRLKVKTK